ncbi:hypothetical protein H4R19_001592 [Coemansia spiralis]|nr:hypothetical protein H4R19_001592 [Coemansia spiralis]
MLTSSRAVLCPADAAVTPRCLIQFFYQNTAGDPRFMEFEILCESFYEALRSSMPLALATDMQLESLWSGGLTVSLDSEPKRPPVTRHIDSKCTVANMIEEGFSRASQPVALDSVPHFTNPLEGDALATLDVVYMADGVGLCLSFSHAAVDLGACVRFCQEWGARARSMYTLSGGAAYQPAELNTDRTWFWEAITAQPAQIEREFDKHIAELAAAAAAQEPEARETSAAQPNETGDINPVYRIEISAAAVGEIGEARHKAAPGVTIPSLLSAVLWRAITQAHPAARYTYFGLSLTVRTNPQFAEYWGNTATMKYLYAETSAFAAMDIAAIARMVQACADEFTLAEFVHILESFTANAEYSDTLARFVSSGRAPRLAISNISRAPAYSVDFGFGPPTKVCYPPSVPAGLVIFFPSSKAGGIDIYLRASDAEIQQIASDSLLKDRIVTVAYDR